MYKYIIKADNNKALAVTSELPYMEFKDYFRSMHVKKIHPDGSDTIFVYGVGQEFINPRVMLPTDFANFGPVILG